MTMIARLTLLSDKVSSLEISRAFLTFQNEISMISDFLISHI